MKKLRLISFIIMLFIELLLWASVYYVQNIPEIKIPIMIFSGILVLTTIIGIIFVIKFEGVFFSIIYFLNIVLSIIMQRYILNMYINNNSVCRFNINPDSLPLIILAVHCIITMLLGVFNYAVTLIKTIN